MDKEQWDKNLNAAARNIHNTLTRLAADPEAHGRTDVYRAGMGDIFPAQPDPAFFLTFTVTPEPPPFDEIREQLTAHPFWRAFAEKRRPVDVLAEDRAKASTEDSQ